jgi:hypothetical protein
MMGAVIGIGVALALAVAWGMRTMRTLRARVAALEAAKDATWADEVRKAIAASK